jgi:hypothetical protein
VIFGKRKKTENPQLEQYQQLRKIGLFLSQELPKKYALQDAIPRIIRLFGIGQGRNIILESEEEFNFIIDFYLHEYEEHNQTPLERYRADTPQADELTVSYLDAAKASYTSLFQIIEIDSEHGNLTVKDLLNPPAILTVLNVNLSRTAMPGLVIFSRLLPYAEFNAFSGMFAAFATEERALLKRYKVMKNRIKSDRESVQRFVALFKLNRTLGVPAETKGV